MTGPTDPMFPIGRFEKPATALAPSLRAAYIHDLEGLPRVVGDLVDGASLSQLGTTYRPGAWTVRQLVHHLADSHLNGYVRVKWALTEDAPTIKLYDQSRWGDLPDTRTAPVEASLRLLAGLHERWAVLLRKLEPAEFDRTFLHPILGPHSIDSALALYRWHGRHHAAHIRIALTAPVA